MKSNVLALLTLLGSSLAIGACAGSTENEADDTDGNEVSSEDALSARLKAGTFALYSRPGVTFNGICIPHTNLVLAPDGTAAMREETCGAPDRFSARTYRLRLKNSSCAGNTYEGAIGRGATRRSIVLNDYREATCADVMAVVVVDERVGTAAPTTLYAGVVRGAGGGGGGTATTIEGTLVQPREGGYSLQKTNGLVISLDLEPAQAALFRAGKKARAKGPIIAAGPAQAMDVSDLLVCPDAGRINCMPGPNRRLSSACAPESHEWIAEKCAGVSFVF